MEHPPTLKDIARNLNLSIGTVQRALNNKGGYSKETQQLVLQEAKRCGYTANPAASALRRPPINLAAVFPSPVEDNRYFFQYIWKGIEKACQDLAVYNIKMIPYYADLDPGAAASKLNSILADTKQPIQGLITTASGDPGFLSALDNFSRNGIPAFLINSVSTDQRPLCFYSNASRGVGTLSADIFAAIHRNTSGKLLLLGGMRENERQAARVSDFVHQLSDSCPDLSVLETHIYDNHLRLRSLIADYLRNFDDLAGIYAVSARETLAMCEAVHESHFSGKITAVGTDVFPELLPYFEDDTLTASIYQYPAQQAYAAVKTLVSYLTRSGLPDHFISIPSAAVFKSNAKEFCELDFLV